jgi:allophanate hydrolase subunit 2
MSVTVVRADLSLVQDAGRSAYSHLGVPTSGAWDSDSYALANWLLAESTLPLFEVLGGSLSLLFDQVACICVVGPAKCDLSGQVSPIGVAQLVPAGQHLLVSQTGPGPAYVGVAGMQVPRTLGSASTCRSGLGPPPISAGDRFETQATPTTLGRHLRPDHVRNFTGHINYLPDPEVAAHDLVDRGWALDTIARNGLRLRATYSTGGETSNHPSGPVLPGTIQLPGPDELIILGPDSGPTGGYPIAGVVVSADLSLLSRIPIGSEVELRPVTLPEAQLLWAKRDSWLAARQLDLGLMT